MKSLIKMDVETEDSLLYTVKWGDGLFGGAVEKIIIDECKSDFSDLVLETAKKTVDKIESETSLQYAKELTREFSKTLSTRIPFLWFDNVHEFYKNGMSYRQNIVWPKYLSNFESGPKLLSELENQNMLTCTGQSLIFQQILDSGWELYNGIVGEKKLVHSLLAKKISDGYACIDVVLANYGHTRFSMTDEEFSQRTIPADIIPQSAYKNN